MGKILIIPMCKIQLAYFNERLQTIENEYKLPAHQGKVENYLRNHLVSDFVTDGSEIAPALPKAYKLILKLSRQVTSLQSRDTNCI